MLRMLDGMEISVRAARQGLVEADLSEWRELRPALLEVERHLRAIAEQRNALMTDLDELDMADSDAAKLMADGREESLASIELSIAQANEFVNRVAESNSSSTNSRPL